MQTAMDRQSPRQRPPGRPLMYQRWLQLLFLHWPLPAAELAALVPAPLELDLFDGQAWIGVVPFTMRRVRPRGLPALPGCSAFHELNVRTYVHYLGFPGVWFFSLDAANPLAVRAARWRFHLPYFDARMRLAAKGPEVAYDSLRTHRDAPFAAFRARWTFGQPLGEVAADSLEFFLTERYCLYACDGQRLWRARIHHPPWPLRRATLHELHSSMLEPLGLRPAAGAPHIAGAERIDVDIFPLERL
jgi:uncharacterized protein YqjF (DUF2071 family)